MLRLQLMVVGLAAAANLTLSGTGLRLIEKSPDSRAHPSAEAGRKSRAASTCGKWEDAYETPCEVLFTDAA
jgi:hypothetical protein